MVYCQLVTNAAWGAVHPVVFDISISHIDIDKNTREDINIDFDMDKDILGNIDIDIEDFRK